MIVPIKPNGVIVPEGAVEKAGDILRSGNIIATPTDTIYGIAALVQNSKAVERLYQIKGRNPKKPIAICVSEIEDIYRWAKVEISRDILNRLLPGAVTLVFERSSDLNPGFNPDTNLIGIRIPDYPFVRQICRNCSGEPLALTSANLSAGKSPLSVQEFKPLWPSLEAIFDGGVLGDTEESRLGSTVVDLSESGRYRIIRDGSALVRTESILQSEGLKRM